jgi:hypothetical protein
MEAYKDHPVTLLCLGEGTKHNEWVDYIRTNLNNWTIQSHGMVHRRYDRCTPEQLLTDLQESKKRLEDTFGVGVTKFYPPFREYKDKMRAVAATAGLTLDGRHRHPEACAQKVQHFNRADFHYWFREDVYATKKIIKYCNMDLTYILGAPRSGTTAYMRYTKSQTPDSLALKEVERIWTKKVNLRMYYAGCLLKAGKSHLIDKNVRNTFRILRLQKAFPDAQFVFIYRNPRAAISSWRDWAVKTGKADTSIEGAARQYLKYVTFWLQHRDKLTNWREERYEQLCDSLDYFKSRDSKWQKRLTASDLKIIDTIVKPIIKEIGYE